MPAALRHQHRRARRTTREGGRSARACASSATTESARGRFALPQAAGGTTGSLLPQSPVLSCLLSSRRKRVASDISRASDPAPRGAVHAERDADTLHGPLLLACTLPMTQRRGVVFLRADPSVPPLRIRSRISSRSRVVATFVPGCETPLSPTSLRPKLGGSSRAFCSPVCKRLGIPGKFAWMRSELPFSSPSASCSAARRGPTERRSSCRTRSRTRRLHGGCEYSLNGCRCRHRVPRLAPAMLVLSGAAHMQTSAAPPREHSLSRRSMGTSADSAFLGTFAAHAPAGERQRGWGRRESPRATPR
jgi:hypothetical protein